MSPWQGKTIIGLTGNIATGKSVVRRMLEHLGAYGIDADALSHRVMAKGAPGYEPILQYFGRWVLDPQQQIDRTRLSHIVFRYPETLVQLENIIHPYVRQAVDLLVRRASQKVVVVEAIKLLEGDLKGMCDSIWVADSPENVQVARLIQKRGLSESEARSRMAAQPPQAEKIKAADVVVRNDKSFENTWRQVAAAWRKLEPGEPAAAPVEEGPADALQLKRARPSMADKIADFITTMTGGSKKMTRGDVMEAFGEKAFMLLMRGGAVVGLVGWQVENLVTRATDFYLDSRIPVKEGVPLLIEEVEKASRELQSEAALLFLPPVLSREKSLWAGLGYESRGVETLKVPAWQEAAKESRIAEAEMLFKQLRVDRVLRPI